MGLSTGQTLGGLEWSRGLPGPACGLIPSWFPSAEPWAETPDRPGLEPWPMGVGVL